MNKNILIVLIASYTFLSACSDESAPQSNQVENATSTVANTTVTESDSPLELLWQTDGLNNPESVVYDENADVLFVSNVNGSPVEKDGNGYISKVLTDGSLLRKQWVTGLNAPKGLAIYEDTLYVADIDTLHAIDIPSGSITESYLVEDAKFLNDVTVDNEGKVFVSDMLLNRIHCLDENAFNIWLESDALDNPNGLHAEDKQLILGAWGVMTDGFATEIPGHLKTISLADKSVQSIGGTPIGNMDGIESDGQSGYYVTDWIAGKLFHVNSSGEATLILELEQGMADHEVIHEQGIILLPMMKNDKLLAYKIK